MIYIDWNVWHCNFAFWAKYSLWYHPHNMENDICIDLLACFINSLTHLIGMYLEFFSIPIEKKSNLSSSSVVSDIRLCGVMCK